MDEGSQPFAVVDPVERGGKLLVVHTVASQRDLDLRKCVLPQVPFPALLVEREDVVCATQGIEQGPIGQAFDGVIGTIVAPPAFNAFKVSALVEVSIVVHLACGACGPEQLALDSAQSGGGMGVEMSIVRDGTADWARHRRWRATTAPRQPPGEKPLPVVGGSWLPREVNVDLIVHRVEAVARAVRHQDARGFVVLDDRIAVIFVPAAQVV